MPTWLQIAEVVCQVADSPLWRVLLVPFVAAFVKLVGCFSRLKRRRRLLARIIDLAQLEPFLSEARGVLPRLDSDLLRQFLTILNMDVERHLPPFKFSPNYYDPRYNLHRLRVEAAYLNRALVLLKDPSVAFIIGNLADELCLLLNIFRRMQLVRNEVKSFQHLKQRYWGTLASLQESRELVRRQIRKLVADYALQELDARLPTETVLQAMDMEDFHRRCQRYEDYREIVVPEAKKA